MKTKTWTTINREGWGEGPWQGEPDKVQWEDVQTGMPCLALRHAEGGHWCGYVGLSPDHPLYGVGYAACALKDTPCGAAEGYDPHCAHSPEALLHVHGGLTFSGPCMEGVPEGEGICHVVEAGEEADVWWLGFDCHHLGDFAPGMGAALKRAYALAGEPCPLRTHWEGESYKPLGYVQAECRRLALQLDDRDFAETHELEG